MTKYRIIFEISEYLGYKGKKKQITVSADSKPKAIRMLPKLTRMMNGNITKIVSITPIDNKRKSLKT